MCLKGIMGCASSMVLPTETQPPAQPQLQPQSQSQQPQEQLTWAATSKSSEEQRKRHEKLTSDGDIVPPLDLNSEDESEDDILEDVETDTCRHDTQGQNKQSGQVTLRSYVPQVYLHHVIALEEEKEKIKDLLETFVFNFDDYQDVGMIPTKGVLLYGPTGCGKSLLAKAFACNYALNFISICVSRLDISLAEELIDEVRTYPPKIFIEAYPIS